MKKTLLGLAVFFLLALVPSYHASAEELKPVTSTSGTTITITAKDGKAMGALYIKWDHPVSEYELQTDSYTMTCGQNGFLHEFIELEAPAEKVEIHLPEKSKMKIYEIRIFTDSDVPDNVQRWNPPHDRADIMLVSAHSDDEILFMGGIIPTYSAEQGARVQVVYMTEFWTTAPIREHEKLDGLWADGLRNYPVCLNFIDYYTRSRETAHEKFKFEELVNGLIDTVRRFRPQIIVTHGFNGEYGHGLHMLTADAVEQVLTDAADDTIRTDTEVYQTYGAWEISKAYFHLYSENPIHMDLRVPLESMGGRTALEVAKAAYKQHVSQQWCSFKVDDEYKHSVANFGLYKTTVGVDTDNNMLENIVLYEEQERIAREEAERLAREQAEREERERQEELKRQEEEAARIAAEEEAKRLEEQRLKEEAQAAAEAAALAEQEAIKRQERMDTLLLVGACLAAPLVLIIVFVVLSANAKRKRQKRNS